MSERESFGDFRSACHNGDLVGAARQLRAMNGEDAAMAFDYATRHFQGGGRMAWMALESVSLLSAASRASLSVAARDAPPARDICGLIEDDELRSFLRAFDRCSVRGWSASFEGEQRAFLFGLELVEESLGRLFTRPIEQIIEDAAKPAPVERVGWFMQDDEPMPTGLLPVLGTTSLRFAGELRWLVCNGVNAGRLVSARYAYNHTIADKENLPWQEVLARLFHFLLTREPNEVLASDPNHEMRLAFWEDLVDLGEEVELFRP